MGVRETARDREREMDSVEEKSAQWSADPRSTGASPHCMRFSRSLFSRDCPQFGRFNLAVQSLRDAAHTHTPYQPIVTCLMPEGWSVSLASPFILAASVRPSSKSLSSPQPQRNALPQMPLSYCWLIALGDTPWLFGVGKAGAVEKARVRKIKRNPICHNHPVRSATRSLPKCANAINAESNQRQVCISGLNRLTMGKTPFGQPCFVAQLLRPFSNRLQTVSFLYFRCNK